MSDRSGPSAGPASWQLDEQPARLRAASVDSATARREVEARERENRPMASTIRSFERYKKSSDKNTSVGGSPRARGGGQLFETPGPDLHCAGSPTRVRMTRVSSIPYAAACQTDFASPAERSEIALRTRRMGEMVEQTITGYEPFFDVRLLAFPEFAHAAPAYDSVAKLRDRLAIPVPNEHTDHYEKLARHYGCYIQTGTFLEADPVHPDLVFNTTALIGPDGLLSKYRKVNPWIPWERGARAAPGLGVATIPVHASWRVRQISGGRAEGLGSRTRARHFPDEHCSGNASR